jgi:NADP-dependent 3-hydroxy acid dehydrogenase YdfG
MATTIDLTGRHLVVTGASSGIGAAVCRSVVRAGATVSMLARRKENLDQLAAELGERAISFKCDVTDHAALEKTLAEAAQRMGTLDGVVAVAGRAMVGEIASGTPAGWRELVDLNLIGPLATARYAMGHFPKEGRRDLIFVGSAGALTPMPGVGIYGATKRGLRAAVDTLRLELAATGISTSLIMPGMFITEGLSETLAFNGDPPVSDLPMFAAGGSPASADVLADAIAFTMSLPDGVTINELVVRPTGQLNP